MDLFNASDVSTFVLLLSVLGKNNTELQCTLQKEAIKVNKNWCTFDFDQLLCWPPSPPNSYAYLPCFSNLNGIEYDTRQNASRYCFNNGSWHPYTDYSSCTELSSSDAVSGLEITTTIYCIGYTISLIALLIAVFIFFNFKDLRCLRNSIHMNLMVSYIMADFVWILTFTLQILLPTNGSTCIILILILHYFHMTNFFWMFVEGLYLYILVVKTFSGENIKLKVYLAIGWGCPMVFVVVWGIAKSFVIPEEDQQDIKICPWTPHVYDWIYKCPVLFVLVINFCFLLAIMWVLITKLRSATSAETQQYRKAAKALLVLIPLLGVTYILFIVGPSEGITKKIYDYTRTVLLSTQGLTVAILYCFMNTEVKNTVRHHFNAWNIHRKLGSTKRRPFPNTELSPKSRDSIRIHKSQLARKRESTSSMETSTTTVVVVHPVHSSAKSVAFSDEID